MHSKLFLTRVVQGLQSIRQVLAAGQLRPSQRTFVTDPPLKIPGIQNLANRALSLPRKSVMALCTCGWRRVAFFLQRLIGMHPMAGRDQLECNCLG